MYPATDAVNSEVPLPTHYRSECIQTPAGVCCYRRGRKYPPMPASAEVMKLLNAIMNSIGLEASISLEAQFASHFLYYRFRVTTLELRVRVLHFRT